MSKQLKKGPCWFLFILLAVLMVAVTGLYWYLHPQMDGIFIFLDGEEGSQFQFCQYIEGSQVEIWLENFDLQDDMETVRNADGDQVITYYTNDGEVFATVTIKECDTNCTAVIMQGVLPKLGSYMGTIEIDYQTSRFSSLNTEADESWLAKLPYRIEAEDSQNLYISSDNEDFSVSCILDSGINIEAIAVFVVAVFYAILSFVLILFRVPSRKSTQYLLDKVKTYEKEEWFVQNDTKAAKNFRTYAIGKELGLFVYMVILMPGSLCMFVYIEEMPLIAFLLSVVVLLVFVTIYEIRLQSRLLAKLIMECAPCTFFLSAVRSLTIHQGVQWRHNYSYCANLAVALYWMGKPEDALAYADALFADVSKKMYNSMYYLHYHSLRASCFMQMKRMSEAIAENNLIRNFINQNPVIQKNAMVQEILIEIDLPQLFISGDYKRIAEIEEEIMTTTKYRYRLIGSQYYLWVMAVITGDADREKVYGDAVLEYGNEMFCKKKIEEYRAGHGSQIQEL